ncbi:membrane-associated phospholipid phosphatase [Desulfosporosinus acidiphilus SJ4]|uniref:Membrane-associated phospholipid phosphatase n=1 Tax=Desulfosporosinus acidiphilus (strain DSM 22704 / JCM 16185 / SJ4) TaxID=646529 RepID=I4D4R2_DESAJ|nr:phosphatase PAP2 family protein [Desulfosporosinus acidiphilus]AFM40786.1 membrane-associated phospholipid phosphatase [Desulfosporosinus acidiphilus SJ4]
MISFYQAIQSIHTPVIDDFFIMLSFLGSEPTYILLISVIYWNIDKRFGFRLATLFLTSMALNGFLKDIINAPRPIGQPGIRSLYLSSATGSSFPSGHSQGAATFYPYVGKHWRSHKVWLGISAFMTLGIGFSRLYLGVHWPQDVLGGYLIGIIIVLGFQQVDERLFKLQIPLRSKLILSLFIPLLFLIIYHTHRGIQMVGFVIGFTSGYFLEDYYLDYRERTRFGPSALKTFLGLCVFGLWAWLWHPLTRIHPWLYLPVFAAGGTWTSFGAPCLYRYLKWERPLKEEEISKGRKNFVR